MSETISRRWPQLLQYLLPFRFRVPQFGQLIMLTTPVQRVQALVTVGQVIHAPPYSSVVAQ